MFYPNCSVITGLHFLTNIGNIAPACQQEFFGDLLDRKGYIEERRSQIKKAKGSKVQLACFGNHVHADHYTEQLPEKDS